LGKYEAERDGRLGSHEETRVLCGNCLVARKQALFPCIINLRCAS
jgi:hypothetical protein